MNAQVVTFERILQRKYRLSPKVHVIFVHLLYQLCLRYAIYFFFTFTETIIHSVGLFLLVMAVTACSGWETGKYAKYKSYTLSLYFILITYLLQLNTSRTFSQHTPVSRYSLDLTHYAYSVPVTSTNYYRSRSAIRSQLVFFFFSLPFCTVI